MDFKEIVSKQYSLNDLFSKKTWINDPKVNMYAAIQDEANELAVSAGWVPWWKGQEPKIDLPNCQVEVVDLLHFHIGAAIQESQYELWMARTDFHDGITEENAQFFIDELNSPSKLEIRWKKGEDLTRYTEQERELVIQELSNRMEYACSAEYSCEKLEAPYLTSVQNYLGAVLTYGARDSLGNFFELARAFDMSSDLVYWMYQAKHALNTFRKQNNYDGKDTTRPKYQKIWNGEEDNFHVMNMVRTKIQNNEKLNTENLLQEINHLYTKTYSSDA